MVRPYANALVVTCKFIHGIGTYLSVNDRGENMKCYKSLLYVNTY